MLKIVTLSSLLFSLALIRGVSAAPLETDYAAVELIAEESAIVPGQSFNLAVHFELAEGWHIYWKNPGASGGAPEFDWELPEGLEVGEVRWPTPKRIEYEGLVSYGYEGEVTFLVTMHASESLEPGSIQTLKAELFWLICTADNCLPYFGDVSIDLPVDAESSASADQILFEEAEAQFPQEASVWAVEARFWQESLTLIFRGENIPADLYFFAEEKGLVDPNGEQTLSFPAADVAELALLPSPVFLTEPKSKLSGVVHSREGAWQIDVEVAFDSEPALSFSSSDSEGLEQRLLSLGLPGYLALAFIGGLILNIMPCVLPVLSLKVFSLLKHVGQTRAEGLKHGFAYTLGVVLSFIVLAGALFALRSFGERIGWGFQLQNPGFMVVLTVVFFLFGLNLMGVFELGGRLVGVDSKVSGRNDLFGSFGMGVLAAVVGAPCMGPLIAGVSGVAVQTDVITGLLIFGTMGLGLASPFLILSIFPKLVAFLPKPGLWMESFKQGMGFLLMAAVVFLVVVAGHQGGTDATFILLTVMLVAAISAWIFGRWGAVSRPQLTQRIAKGVSVLMVAASLFWAIPAAKAAYEEFAVPTSSEASADGWEAWTDEKVDAYLEEGRPVFIDFTATWCLVCQVNKKVALRTDATRELFEEYNVAPLSADWTRYDPAITEALESFGRSGVPLYVLYTPEGEVTVLPQSLTNGIVRDAVESVLAPR